MARPVSRIEDVQGAIRQRIALGLVDVDSGVLEVPLELGPGGLEHSPGGIGDLGAGAVTPG